MQDQGYTALLFACFKGHEKCVELLLNHHADVNVRDKVFAVVYSSTGASLVPRPSPSHDKLMLYSQLRMNFARGGGRGKGV